jgi:transposase
MLPAKADPEKQKEFLEQELQPRLDEAQAGKRVVLFVDAAHFVLAPFLGFLWSVVRVFIQAPCGRQRFNVLGALNAITHELTTITNDAYITSVSVCELLEKIAKRYQDIPISIFLDNARYQRCAVVIEKAKSLNIELCFLPSYSPNLNLIERMWKFVKKKCLYSKYYEKFPEFKEAISKCLDETTTTHKSDLDSLLTLRFQRFQKPQFVTP